MKLLELFFAKWINIVIRFRFITLLLIATVTIILGIQIKYLQFDTSNEGFLHDDDPILLTYNDFRDQFGRDDMLVITIESDNIFSKEFLTKLNQLHDELYEKVPYVNEITSMANARNTKGEGNVLLVDDLLENFPQTHKELEDLKQLVLQNPLYKNQLISEDSRFTTLMIESNAYSGSEDEEDLFGGFEEEQEKIDTTTQGSGKFLSDKENSEFVQSAYEIATKYNSEDFTVYIAGSPIVMHYIKQFMQGDMKKFLRFAILIIGLCLFILFRRISGVILPLLTVILSLISTLGLMVLCGVSFKVPTTILPSFILAVGVGACVHILSLTYQNIRNGKEKVEAITSAYAHSGLAIVMTSMTTAAGLASFAMAELAPIADLGMFSAIGVMLCLFYTLTFMPALLTIIPIKKTIASSSEKSTKMDTFLDWITDFSVNRYKVVLSIATIFLVIGIAGVMQVSFSHNVLKWLPEDLDARIGTEKIDKELRGSVVLEVVVDSGRENGIYNRELLETVEQVMTEVEQDYANTPLFVGKTISVTSILKEIHQALHENNPEFYKIPENEKLIPQEFLLFENSGSDDLEDVVDSQFRLMRATIKVPWQDALVYVPFIQDITSRFETAFADQTITDQPVKITVTGLMALFGRIIHAAIYSASQSYLIAFVVITCMMILLIGNVRLGVISMIPNLTPILMVLGFMGWFGFQLDLFTILIASIAIGLAVDDTVHFMYNFKRYYEQLGNVREAVKHTLHTAGRAMLTTSIVLSIGFFIFTCASMNNLFNFGILTGAAIILALMADLFLAPALMTLIVYKTKILNPTS